MKTTSLPTVWNLKPLLAGDDDPSIGERRQEIERANYRFINKWRKRSDYLRDAETLREALDELEELSRQFGTEGAIGFYFGLRQAQDQNDPVLRAHNQQIQEFGTKIANDLRFFELKLSRIDASTRSQFLKTPQLQKHRHYLEHLFAWSPHLLSEKEESILSLKQPVAHSNWVSMLSGFLAKEEREITGENGIKSRLAFSEISSLMDSPVKSVRDEAAAAFNDILARHVEVAENELNSILANKKVNDTLRMLPRPDSARHLGDDIETEAVDAMVDAVSRRFDLPARYYRLKGRLLGLPKLAYHERNLSYGASEEEYGYERSVSLVEAVFQRLDPEFATILRKMADGGQIDVFPRPGKVSGAFCADQLMVQPVYVLLNHTGRRRDVLTLAHEIGHAIHSHLVFQRQNALQADYTLATAEVASTFMEDFVLEGLLSEADDEARLSLLMMKLNDEVSTIFRQVALYRFEQQLHADFRAKGYLSKEEIGALFSRHMAAYMGEAVEQSPGSPNWWVHWSHIRNFFYVYSYASGLLISKALQAKVRSKPSFIKDFKELLGSGMSASPKELFGKAGIDISNKEFWKEGIAGFERLLEEAEKLAARLEPAPKSGGASR